MQVKTIREFEEGDIIVNTMYNWVAIRVVSPLWYHSNEGTDLHNHFTDEQVNCLLDHTTWTYVGNRRDFDASRQD